MTLCQRHLQRCTNDHFRKGKAEKNGTLGWGHFGYYIVFGKVYFIIMRAGYFSFVGEPAGSFFFIEFGLPNNRHNRKLPVIIDPWAGLMGLFETANFVCSVNILPAIPHFPVWGVQKFIPQGREIAGYVFPVESS